VATKITNGNHGDSLQGSPEKRLDLAPDGSLWAALVVQGGPGAVKFFRSADGGNSWVYASTSDVSLEQSSAVPSFFIDADGFAHLSWIEWNRDPQIVKYARGTPTGTSSANPGWSWTTLTISPASGRTGVDSDVIAFRSGTGWVAFVEFTQGPSGGAQVARVQISASGVLTVGTTTTGPSAGLLAFQYGTLEFAHTGDGKTPSAAPHIYFTTGVQASSQAIVLNKAVYSGGVWTWGTGVTIDTGNLLNTALCSVYDGTKLMVAYSKTSATINVYEWDGTNTPVARNPPAAPGGTGNVLGLSMSVDSATQNVYLAYYDATDGDIRYSVFTRSTTTWSAWAVAVSQTPPSTGDDGKIQLVRHPSRDSVDMLYAQGGGTSWQIYYQQLAALVRSPTAPTLVSPASGASADLASGQTFTWLYNQVSPGDTQQGWAFRRVHSATTEYWNATTQAWVGSAVYNATSTTTPFSAIFAAGNWTTGTTYVWSVSTKSSTGATSPFAAGRTVVATTAPAVVVTAPAGIIYQDSTPLVTWTYTSTDTQRDYQVRIIADQASIDPNSTTPVWDSGVISSAIARSARVGITLTDGGTFWAYVRSTGTAGVQSAWAASQFTISLTPPSGPLIETLDEVDFFSGAPFVEINILAQSSFLTAAQNIGTDGWENDTNTTVAAQATDTTNQLLAGLLVTSAASGLMGVRSEVGSPPLAPYGQTQPAGPLSFPVVAGQVYTALASFRTASLTRAARMRIRWYDADDGTGSLISESVGNQVVINSVGYSQAFETDSAPVGALLARVVMEVLGAVGSGEMVYEANPSFHPGRTQAWQPGGYSSTQTVRVERSDDGGTTWNQIIDRVKPTLRQQASFTDRLMPFNTEVSYRGYTDVDPGLGAAVESAVSLVATLTVDADRWGIRDLTEPANELYAIITAHNRSDDEQSSISHPSGREYPIIDTEGEQAATGTLTIFIRQADIPAATAILRSTSVFIVQSPSGVVFNARLIRRKYNVYQVRHRQIDVDYYEVE
jgi:hypothetical protein